MKEQIRLCLVALLSLGLASSYSIAAAAQEIIEDTYTVEDVDPPADVIEDDTAVIVDDDDDPEVVIADRDGLSRCAATFRSFDPDSGTYVTYDGETVLCPYLE